METRRADSVIAKRITELERIEGIQDRIDCIADDVKGKKYYAVIPARALALLVDLDFEYADDWEPIYFDEDAGSCPSRDITRTTVRASDGGAGKTKEFGPYQL